MFQQNESTQRHEDYLQTIRDRAFDMTITRHSTEDHNDAPKLTPYERNKLCSICNALVSFITIVECNELLSKS